MTKNADIQITDCQNVNKMTKNISIQMTENVDFICPCLTAPRESKVPLSGARCPSQGLGPPPIGDSLQELG
jgi:hypothetical protein